MRILIPLLIIPLMATSSCVNSGESSSKQAAGEAAHAAAPARSGEQIFRQECARCHAPESIGVKPPMFVTVIPLPRGEMDAARAAYVEQMIRGGGKAMGRSSLMPAFEEKVPEVELQAVLEWLGNRQD